MGLFSPWSELPEKTSQWGCRSLIWNGAKVELCRSPTCHNERDHPLLQLVVGANLLKLTPHAHTFHIWNSNGSSPQKVAHFLKFSCGHRDSSCIPSQIVSFSFRRHQTSTGWSAPQTREGFVCPHQLWTHKGVRSMVFTMVAFCRVMVSFSFL